MRLKEGDRVLIRDGLICNLRYGESYFRDGMVKGMVVTVERISDLNNAFTIKEERLGFWWYYTPEMCAGKVLEDNKVVKINEV